ncbi:HNH endonuclease [Sphingobium sp. DEHP117]|uniref:HNH endonuclease n=1 Tax=Sphingobium sp. DEHP117 TaxID=2993436 RepID=UPI0027D52F83|nr:HNH endonuclease [Sphingobium sp. DEHP117]MDQ4421461.1 HNH endonuclease [Sphingobium sp. DEHP117]
MAQIRKECVSIDFLREIIAYDPETGVLTWLPRKPEYFIDGKHSSAHRAGVWNARYAGKPALASRERQGYGHGDILAKRYKAHRVAWAIHYGFWPETGIDQINGNRADNRILNLRLATMAENMKNQRFSKANTSGVMGVSWASHRGKWSAQIKVNRRKIHLGLFTNIADAARARKAAEKRYGFHPNHGKLAV